MKKCPYCGADVLDRDIYCPKCNESVVDVKQVLASTDYRSRWMLLFQFMLGHDTGRHLRWLGFDAKADEVAANNKQYVSGFFRCMLEMFKNPVAGIAIFFGVFVYGIKECIEMCAIIFGRYSEDAQGRPVRYFNPHKGKKATTTPKLTLTDMDFSKSTASNGIAEIGSTKSVPPTMSVDSDVKETISAQDVSKQPKGGGIGVPVKGGLGLATDVADVNITDNSSVVLKGDSAEKKANIGLTISSDDNVNTKATFTEGSASENKVGLGLASATQPTLDIGKSKTMHRQKR